MLLHVGSPQSKEGDDRIEAKIDAILLAVEPEKGNRLVDEIDREYEGRHTDARFVRQLERRTAPELERPDSRRRGDVSAVDCATRRLFRTFTLFARSWRGVADAPGRNGRPPALLTK